MGILGQLFTGMFMDNMNRVFIIYHKVTGISIAVPKFRRGKPKSFVTEFVLQYMVKNGKWRTIKNRKGNIRVSTQTDNQLKFYIYKLN